MTLQAAPGMCPYQPAATRSAKHARVRSESHCHGLVGRGGVTCSLRRAVGRCAGAELPSIPLLLCVDMGTLFASSSAVGEDLLHELAGVGFFRAGLSALHRPSPIDPLATCHVCMPNAGVTGLSTDPPARPPSALLSCPGVLSAQR